MRVRAELQVLKSGSVESHGMTNEFASAVTRIIDENLQIDVCFLHVVEERHSLRRSSDWGT
jgi:hypothetical protein